LSASVRESPDFLKSGLIDGDGVALAVIVTNKHRAGFELAPGRAAVARQTRCLQRSKNDTPWGIYLLTCLCSKKCSNVLLTTS
jgi:hypothetical protein